MVVIDQIDSGRANVAEFQYPIVQKFILDAKIIFLDERRMDGLVHHRSTQEGTARTAGKQTSRAEKRRTPAATQSAS